MSNLFFTSDIEWQIHSLSLKGWGGVGGEILQVASCHRDRDKLWPDGPLGWYANFNITYQFWSSKRDINKCLKYLREKNEQV